MKRSFLFLLLAGSLVLTACETTVVSRRPVVERRVVFTDREVYRETTPTYRRVVYEDDVRYRTRAGTNRDFPARPLDRTYGF